MTLSVLESREPKPKERPRMEAVVCGGNFNVCGSADCSATWKLAGGKTWYRFLFSNDLSTDIFCKKALPGLGKGPFPATDLPYPCLYLRCLLFVKRS